MDLNTAIKLSSIGQACYEDVYGNLYLATINRDSGEIYCVRRKRKSKDFKSMDLYRILEKSGNKWDPVCPKD